MTARDPYPLTWNEMQLIAIIACAAWLMSIADCLAAPSRALLERVVQTCLFIE
jgi:hypothetical protein